MLPDYISKAVPNPASNRAPWYKNTAPTYAGVFLWIVFYKQIAINTLDRAGVGLCLLALVVAGLLSYLLFYRAPAMLGMQTGLPLYVIGSSTFGTAGGYLMPGLLMGLLQVGWISVNAFVSAGFVLNAIGSKAGPGSTQFSIIAGLWALAMGYIGVKGIQYVSRFSTFLNWVPLLMIIFVFVNMAKGVSQYTPPVHAPYLGFMLLIQIVVGFFATAGAATKVTSVGAVWWASVSPFSWRAAFLSWLSLAPKRCTTFLISTSKPSSIKPAASAPRLCSAFSL